MAEKPKAVRPKAKEDQKEQSKRFIETARKLGVDESGQEFERALKQLFRRSSEKGS